MRATCRKRFDIHGACRRLTWNLLFLSNCCLLPKFLRLEPLGLSTDWQRNGVRLPEQNREKICVSPTHVSVELRRPLGCRQLRLGTRRLRRNSLRLTRSLVNSRIRSGARLYPGGGPETCINARMPLPPAISAQWNSIWNQAPQAWTWRPSDTRKGYQAAASCALRNVTGIVSSQDVEHAKQ